MLFADVARYAALDKRAVRWADCSAVHGGEPFWREAASLDLGAAIALHSSRCCLHTSCGR